MPPPGPCASTTFPGAPRSILRRVPLSGSPRTANVVTEDFTEVLEIPAATLRELRGVPEMDRLINLKLSERLTRTANADLVRLAGLDQRDLQDLRRRRREPGAATDATTAEPSTA